MLVIAIGLYAELSISTWIRASADGTCDAGCRVHLVKKKGDRP
jgi:hypothetical protein